MCVTAVIVCVKLQNITILSIVSFTSKFQDYLGYSANMFCIILLFDTLQFFVTSRMFAVICASVFCCVVVVASCDGLSSSSPE